MAEFVRASFFSRAILNAPVALAARLGLSLGGANALTTRGVRSGEPRTTPVNPVTVDDRRYLVAPRGETFWVRNVRASGEADLRLGRRQEHVRLTELADAEKPPIIARYLERWGNITRRQFGTTAKHPDAAELARLAARTPVFRVE